MAAPRLLAERARVASLQLRYREAATWYRRAADAVGFDAAAAWTYLLAAANALYAQEQEFGDNAALFEAIETSSLALDVALRERVPLEWATTQNNLGNALQTLGTRESGTARLEEAVAAYDLCLEVTASVWPPEWVRSVHDHRDAVLAELARRR